MPRFSPFRHVIITLYALLGSVAYAGVNFSYHLVGTANGYNEYELDVASFTGIDATTPGNGVTSFTGTLTASSGSFLVLGASANTRRVNFSNQGINSGLGGGTTWFNFDSFAGSPTFTPNSTSPTSINNWTLFTADSGSWLTPSTTTTNSSGFPSNVLGEVYITVGGTFNLSGNYNTKVSFNTPIQVISNISIDPSPLVSLASSGGGISRGAITVLSSGANKYSGQVLKFASPVPGGTGDSYVAINNIGGTDTGDAGVTEVILWTGGTDTPAQLAAMINGPFGLATILTGPVDQDSTDLFTAYGNIGAGLGIGAPTLILRFSGQTDASNNFFHFNLPAGDTLVAITAVPEPASLGLLAIGALGLMGRRSKK